ncbi:MAG TPA: bacterioferritin [Vicinamibacterales bacterium]|nr:bacterioferritin [Vicinamibacterales bacterium]
MKGHADIIKTLNDLLAEELTAINQYMVHSEMCDNWGFEKLHKAIEKQAIDEMKHAESLIARILFLEGSPTVSRLNQINIGKTVGEMLGNDLDAEAHAVKMYNDAVQQAQSLRDEGTRDLLRQILHDEEEHLDWDEQQRDLIEQMGIENYLASQTS